MAKINAMTPAIKLSYCNIKGEGIDGKFLVRAKIKKGSKEDKEMKALLKEHINHFIEEGVIDSKDDLDNLYYRPLMKPDPKSKRNKKNKIKDWVDTDYMIFQAKTATKFGDQDVTVRVYDRAGTEVTEDYQNASEYFGDGTKAVIYFKVDFYDVDNNTGLTAYLDKVQVLEPVYAEGGVPVQEFEEGEELVFGQKKKKKKKDKKKKKGKKDE